MTDIVNPSTNRTASSYLTAGTISEGGAGDGFVVSDSPTQLAEFEGLDETELTSFDETSSSTSLDVTIHGGEAFIFGSYVARDTDTTVTLESNESGQVVYVGWDHEEGNEVIIGLEEAFDDFDPKIKLYSYNTDSSGVIN